jgi:hypothetical protein
VALAGDRSDPRADPRPSHRHQRRLPVWVRDVVVQHTGWGFTIILSFVAIFASRWERTPPVQPLPPYPPVDQRTGLFLVLGEHHYRTTPTRGSAPRWLVMPARGLYTGLAIIGATGSGKTSACLQPYLDQLFGYRADDPLRKVGGLFLEVKGDFCRRVHAILRRHDRDEDYVEVSLGSRYRYNPLHNDLEPTRSPTASRR